MNINNLYVTQRKLRNPVQLVVMIAAIEAGDPLPPITLVESEEGIVIEDGHHRALAYWLAGRECLRPGEYLLVQKELSHKRRFGRIKDLWERVNASDYLLH